MKYTVVNALRQEDRHSYLIEVTCFDNNFESDKFKIPVIDVRDGDEARKKVNEMIKDSNRSRYTQPTFSVIGKSYQVSHKKISE